MRTPYPELTRDDEARRALFADWNARNEASRREYYLNPTAACGVSYCDRLRARGRMCSSHGRVNGRGTL